MEQGLDDTHSLDLHFKIAQLINVPNRSTQQL